MNYPSDLTDTQWALIVELTARPDPRGAVRWHPMREIINAILYVNKTGCQWCQLPVNFARWATIYDHFRRFRQRGAWEAMMLRLNGNVREKRGRAFGHALCGAVWDQVSDVRQLGRQTQAGADGRRNGGL